MELTLLIGSIAPSLGTVASDLTADVGSGLGIALPVAAAIFGAVVLWALFKRLAKG